MERELPEGTYSFAVEDVTLLSTILSVFLRAGHNVHIRAVFHLSTGADQVEAEKLFAACHLVCMPDWVLNPKVEYFKPLVGQYFLGEVSYPLDSCRQERKLHIEFGAGTKSTRYKPGGVVRGRFQCKEPNITAVPRENPYCTCANPKPKHVQFDTFAFTKCEGCGKEIV